ncbi:hypothetical protein [Spirochaeta africana]|uniref:Outer membrane protein beta-barrel domain-containing protein n=1 Tax=Spirochaeta africana (strain ATCC 700263 / DSM 8902 / Z-7692) TaxID=889378 RepID=H9UH45_SPIAZ|nr:hypothetical protein [Spirochaeta africana]AFG36838.1 hypothetical protein Spiaf_0743 [Spirochaeta africana DSM 8902]
MIDRRRLLLTVCLVWLASALPVSAAHIPGFPAHPLELETFARLFYRTGDIELMADYATGFSGEPLQYQSSKVTLGGYYRLHRNVKAGLFYSFQSGMQHDDDWIVYGDGNWKWEDTRSRWEQVLSADVSPRFMLDFLPGRTWVFMQKLRYSYNFYNNHQILLARPGLTYFHMVEREPVVNIGLQYAVYGALNFGPSPVYRHGPYINILYHFSPHVQFSVGAGRQIVRWDDSADFRALHPDESYADRRYRPWIIDAGVLFRLGSR